MTRLELLPIAQQEMSRRIPGLQTIPAEIFDVWYEDATTAIGAAISIEAVLHRLLKPFDNLEERLREVIQEVGREYKPPPKHIVEELIRFEEYDQLWMQCLREYFVKLADELPEVRSYRERVILGSSVATEDVRMYKDILRHPCIVDGEVLRPGLSGKELEQAMAEYTTKNSVPEWKPLSEKAANEFVTSLATQCLSRDQFKKWNIPVIGHKITRGVPARYQLSDFGGHKGDSFFLTIEPPGAEFMIRASRPEIVIDGFRVIAGKNAPIFPAQEWKAESTKDAVLSVAIRNPELWQQWEEKEPSDADTQTRMEYIRQRLAEDDAALPTYRKVTIPLENTLCYLRRCRKPSCEGCSELQDTRPNPPDKCWFNDGKVDVWPGSVLDDLRAISERLAGLYHWDKAEATWFVLTGYTPIMMPFRPKTTTSSGGYFTDASISMEISPWVSSATVYRVYKGIQRRLLGRKFRRDERTLRVFSFVTREVGLGIQGKDKDRRWPELLRKWNEAHSQKERFEWPADIERAYFRAKATLLQHDYANQAVNRKA